MPAVSHPPGCYWVQPSTGTIQRQCNPLLAGLLGQVGFVGQSGQQPGIGGHAFPTFDDAKKYIALNPSVQGKVAKDVQNLGGLQAIGDFFNRLTQKNTWIRVGEAVAGLLLVWIGLSAITKGTAAEAPIKQTKKAIGTAASLSPPGRALKVEKAARRRVAETRVRRRARQLNK
jgi:hypothetical protein